MHEEKPTHLDLFSGIGGFALAAERSGFRTVGFSEIDPYASAVLRKHWPDVPNFGDIRNVPAMRCDLVTGGFPCQPFSIAGFRKGKNDDRYLWPAMLAVIKSCRPRWVLGENVTNIQNMVLSDCSDALEEVGYIVKSFDIPACALGLPTMERHTWIVAAAAGERCEGSGKESVAQFTQITEQLQGSYSEWPERWHLPASRVCRVGQRIPNRLDRLKCLGNAIDPYIAQAFLCGIYRIIQDESATVNT